MTWPRAPGPRAGVGVLVTLASLSGLNPACSGEPAEQVATDVHVRSQREDPRIVVDPALRRAARARAPGAPGWRSLLVESDAPLLTRRDLEQRGARVDTVAGQILTARVPAPLVRELPQLIGVRAVEAARSVHARLDRARAAAHVDEVHQGAAPLRVPRTGRGVVVGIVDRSLDLSHPALRTADGISRVVALWDQASFTGSPPPARGYGSYCSEDELRVGTCAYGAGAGNLHGTHVTGIAAGGIVAGQPFTGVAPDAEIVFVNLGTTVHDEDFTEALSASVCDAVAFVFEVAAQRGAPAVVNMSFGTQADPHDGSSLANQCLDSLAGPGRILVASAGNEGRPVEISPGLFAHPHVHATATPEQPAEFGLFPVQDDAAQAMLYGDALSAGVPAPIGDASLYFDAGLDLAIQIGVLDAGALVWAPRAVRVGTPDFEQVLQGASGALGPYRVACGEVRPGGTRLCELAITDADLDRAELTRELIVRVSGDGVLDGFMNNADGAGFAEAVSGVTLDARMTVGYPASSREVLAVGSYVTRETWRDSRGNLQERVDAMTGERVVPGALSTFSSRGPARDVAFTGLRPDVTAPGEVIVSALNRRLTGASSEVVVESPGGYLVLSGTSMAAGVVTGVVAAMLEVDPALSVDDVRAILDATARAPDGVSVPSEEWGRGMIDAFAAVTAAEIRAASAGAAGFGGEGGAGAFSGALAGATGLAGVAEHAGVTGASHSRPLRREDGGCSCSLPGEHAPHRCGLASFSLLALGLALARIHAHARGRASGAALRATSR